MTVRSFSAPIVLALLLQATFVVTPKARAADADVATPAELSIGVPPGWGRQQDTQNNIVIMLPPNSPSINQAGLVVFPATSYSGTGSQFHEQALKGALGGGRLLEPVRHGNLGGFLVSSAHLVATDGTDVRLILATAHWSTRAQAVLFAAAREDLFRGNLPAAEALLTKVQVPADTAAPPLSSAQPRSNVPAPGAVATSPPESAPSSAPGGSGESADTMPVLNYDEPANFYRGAIKSFAEYSSSEVNYSLCVYPFRPFNGNIEATFRHTLLRDWIDLRYKEQSLSGPPTFTTNSLPGATAVIQARFHENNVGLLNERMRILIVAGNMAAIIDAKAINAYCWQKAGPSVTAMLGTVRVGKKAAPPSLAAGPGPAGAALAGCYGGIKPKYMASGFVDFTSHVRARHFYLFSPDGRVFRCYDTPPAGGDWRRFDFETAAREDPVNSGRFAVRGNELHIKMGGQLADEIDTTITEPDLIVIDTVKYARLQ